MMMNLFVGILVDTFDLQHTPHVDEDDPDAVDFSVDDMWVYRSKWRRCCLASAKDKPGGVCEELAHFAPSSLELPYSCFQDFLFDLCERKTANEQRSGNVHPVLHVHPESPDWMYYALLQAELYAYKIKPKMRLPGLSLSATMASFKKEEPEGGAAPRRKHPGLNFFRIMERLMLLRVGKNTMMYQQQMEESDLEMGFVAQNTLVAMLSAKIRCAYASFCCVWTCALEWAQ